jgi:hypothetical protein
MVNYLITRLEIEYVSRSILCLYYTEQIKLRRKS